MTKVINSAEAFSDEALDGLVSVYPQYLEKTYGGVISVRSTRPGKVAVVIGGGSGHYPAFAGWVGPGLADGAVVGNIFASPSTQQIYAVAKALAEARDGRRAPRRRAGSFTNGEAVAELRTDRGMRRLGDHESTDLGSLRRRTSSSGLQPG